MAYDYIDPKYLNQKKDNNIPDMSDYWMPDTKKYVTQEEVAPSGIDWSKINVSAPSNPTYTAPKFNRVEQEMLNEPTISNDKSLTNWQKYKIQNPNTPDILKPLGYALEAPFRIPVVNRLIGAASKTAVGERSIADNAPINTYNSNSGKVLNTVADITGSGLGMVAAPQYQQLGQLGNIGENVASNLLNKVGVNTAGKLAQYGLTGLRSAGEMGTLGGIEANLQGANLKDTGKAIRDNALMGAAFGVGSKALGEGLGAIKSSAFPKWKTTFESNEPVQQPIQETAATSNVNTSVLKPGKYTVKNTALGKAQTEYDNAVKAIQDYTGHNKLTEDEILNASIALNIDPFKLVDNIAKAEKGVNLSEIGNDAKWKNIVGLQDNLKSLNRNSPMSSTINENPLSNTLGIPTESNAQNGFKLNTDKPTIKQTEPTENILNPSIGATDRTQSIVGFKSSKTENKTSLGQKLDDFYTHVVDVNNPIKKIDDPTYTLATNSKKVGGTVSHIVNNELVDMNGNKIGESLGNIAKDIPKGEENDFFYYLMHNHNIDRAREGKPVFPDYTPEQSKKSMQLLEQRNPKYKEVANRLTKFINSFETEWGNKSGLVSDELWQQLNDMYKNYVPGQRSFSEIEMPTPRTQGKGYINQRIPINKATGSERDIINPLENVMRLVDRTVRTARYNEVGQSFADALRSNPKLSKYAEILPADAEINPNVKNVVSVLENGKPVNIQVNDKRLLEALNGLYKSNDLNTIEKGAKAFNNVFKSLITTKNPVFAVRNIMRDLPTGYINGSEKNPAKYLVDWVKASKDLLSNSEVAQQYRGLGGESSNFLNTEKLYKNADDILGRKLKTDSDGFITGSKQKNPLANGLNFMGEKVEKLNNVTESSTRLAEFKRILEKTGDPQKALYAAGEVTTNFSRGGDLTKWMDVFVPYANAGVQGLDKLARQLDPRNPKQLLSTLVKGGIGVGIPTIAFHVMNQDNPYYKELDNRTKDNYFLIPNILGTKDDKGIPTTFIKIPKSREYGVLFSTLFERLQRATSKEPEAFKGFGSTIATNFAPANPLEDNLASPLLNLRSNKDFADRAIVPQSMLSDERSKYLQYDEKTSELTKAIAKYAQKAGLDLSPKQMDYLIKSYTGVVGQLGLPLTVKGGTTTASKALKPLTTQFVSDPLYSNQTSTDFYDNLQKAKQAASDKNLLYQVNSKVVTPQEELRNKLNKIQTEITATNKEILKADNTNDQEKVKELRKKILDLMKSGNDMYYKSK